MAAEPRRGRGRRDLTVLAPELRPLTRRTAALGVAATACTLAGAVLLAHAIAIGVEGVPRTDDAVRTLGALAVAVLLRAALGAAAEIDGRRTGHRAVAALRRRVVVMTLASASSGAARPGALAATSVHGAGALADYAGRYVPQRAVAGVGPILALAAVAAFDPLSAALLAVAVPIVILFLALVGLQARDAAEHRTAALGLLDGHLLDVLRGLPVLRAFGREDVQIRQVRVAGESYRRGTMAVLRAAFLSGFVLEFVAMLGTALVAVACGIRLAAGDMAFAPAIAALVLAPEVFAPLRRLGAEYHAAAEAEPVLRALVEGGDRDHLVPTGEPDGPLPDPAREALVLRGVRVAAPGRERPALDGLDLHVAAGRTTALVGPPGSGKTTVLRLLAGLRGPDGGTVGCGDVALADADLDGWRAGVAWIPQHPVLLPGTLRENVALGADADDAALGEALRAVGLGPLLRALPHGLDTVVGDGGLPLSAGERRRVAIARAIASRPRLVLVDEPTANLDAVTAAGVVDALEHLLRGRTAVLCTHDSAPLSLADEVVALRDGRRDGPVGPVGDPPPGLPAAVPATAGARA
ncbi:thiol reductant ABC exporter subunit CydD [Patulibacter sp.]|uniref:thiol reductant ABC exporter subunit CydD n=1 Tax=Patulibacter sp. TaxID=1912859 RepID=UPI002717321F|nr:thiol reductant ABC exporter subunit CydD [Patulibacter sp.]MDO9410868.1 thiol reductant ABC exporter subunit CydD [Patulibacter sp.]